MTFEKRIDTLVCLWQTDNISAIMLTRALAKYTIQRYAGHSDDAGKRFQRFLVEAEKSYVPLRNYKNLYQDSLC